MERAAYQFLADWAINPRRKVLLVRGARQVGKTYAVRHLGKSYEYFLEVNFERDRPVRSFFEGALEPEAITRKLSAYFSVPVVTGKTLLFLDEIQACPEAIAALRFFQEDMPGLHVVAAGSLLEFALEQIPSMGVGRISSLFMYPMSFCEFLTALGDQSLRDMMLVSGPLHPLDVAFHDRLVERLREYLLIGGLPEAVQTYVSQRDLRAVQTVLDDLIVTITDDFAKYRDRAPVLRLTEVFESIPFQAGSKFKYATIGAESSTPPLKYALDLLEKASIAHKVVHTSARGLPLGAQVNPKKFKVVLFDVGIQQRMLGLNLSQLLVARDFKAMNRGNVAEVFIGQELLAYSNPASKTALHYWHREARSSNAEVDYVMQVEDAILPVEVKAGTKGQMQSLRIFMQDRALKKGIRMSLENFGSLGDIEILPLYAARCLFPSI